MRRLERPSSDWETKSEPLQSGGLGSVDGAGASGACHLRVLHICSDFARQKLYAELVKSLGCLGIRQVVYVPVRTSEEMGKNADARATLVEYRFAHLLHRIHRVLFRAKIRTILRDIVPTVDLQTVSNVHAHFLFSDGAVALQLRRQFDIPFLVAVRNTDMNVFFKYRPDLRPLAWQILKAATTVVFLSPAYRIRMLELVPRWLRPTLEEKCLVVPNGLGRYWLENPAEDRRPDSDALRLLYVGDLSKNKNVLTSVRATALLNERRKTTLTIVGSGGDGERALASVLASEGASNVCHLGRVEDPRELLEIYRTHDIFVMPSFRETFGVAYLEALSQGLPVVYSKGEAIDGYFEPHTVGEGVEPRSPEAVRDGVLAIAARLGSVRKECVARARAFSWQEIARTYSGLYEVERRQRPAERAT